MSDEDRAVPVRRMTVSELIRETKDDWEHTATRERHSSTEAYSGPFQVQVTGPTSRSSMVPMESFEEQVELQRRQNDGEEDPMTLWDEDIIDVEDRDGVVEEDRGDDSRVARGPGTPASGLPGG